MIRKVIRLIVAVPVAFLVAIVGKSMMSPVEGVVAELEIHQRAKNHALVEGAPEPTATGTMLTRIAE